MTPGRLAQASFAGVVLLSLVMLFSPASGVPSGFEVNDKVVHAALFAALAATGRLAGISGVPLLAGLVAYAGISEVLQSVLPINRHGDVRDGLADVLGVLAGLALVAVGARFRQDRRVGA